MHLSNDSTNVELCNVLCAQTGRTIISLAAEIRNWHTNIAKKI